jgi:hypothetical protein
MATQKADLEPTSTDARRAAEGRGLPGLAPAAGAALLAGVGVWIWLASAAASVNTPSPANVTSELAEVSDGELTSAITTLDVPVQQQFAERSSGCRQPLAWVALASASDQAGIKIRLLSGSYYSPTYTLTPSPIRVAVPFPTPYETGRGTLVVLNANGSAIVALTPAWRTPSQGQNVHNVVWRPGSRCKKGNG